MKRLLNKTYRIFSFYLVGICLLCSCQKNHSASERDSLARANPNFYTGEPPQRIHMPPLPDTLSFAGERVPLDRDDVREGVEHELVINTFRHSSTIFILKRIERWRPLIEKSLREKGVPSDFIYLAVAESEFRNDAQSYAGAVGMWQFMPATARDYNLDITADADMRRDPRLATEAAGSYLKWAHRYLKSWSLVAASYNRGLRGMQSLLQQQQTDTFWDLYLNPETARYVYRIIAFKLILENPERYGYFLAPEEQYQPHQFEIVKVDHPLDLIQFARKHQTTYKQLRELNPWFNNTSSYQLRVPPNKAYEIRIPSTKKIPGL